MTPASSPSQHAVVLVALDGTPSADLVLERAVSLASALPNAELHLLHVPDRFTSAPITAATFDLHRAGRYIEACAERARAASGLTTIAHVVEHEPASAILHLAAQLDADLVVVGTGDKHGPERWLLGSVGKKVAERAPCPVLVVRDKDHATGHAPEIEPPCPDCHAQQRATRGAKLWCARHGEHHPRGHLHYEIPEGFGAGSGLLRP
jgi:nucleotide-binding universal stress UspA family protein